MKESLQNELSNFIKNWELERNQEKVSEPKDDSKLQKQLEGLIKERNTQIVLNKDRLNEVNYWRKKYCDTTAEQKTPLVSTFTSSKQFTAVDDTSSKKYENLSSSR